MRTPILIPALIAAALVALAGCRDEAPATPATTPAVDAPPAVATDAPPAVDAVPGIRPAAGTITFAGFGPAPFGADEEAVRMAWGKALEGAPDDAGGCYFLAPAPRGAPPFPFAFMFEGGKFARIDVRSDAILAPGGGKVGMSADDIARLYPAMQSTPHKYVEGARTLRTQDAAGGPAALVFETDAGGAIVAWRIGVPPQIDYVEGCG
ncbi:lectin [Lysobacter hankyongensis]|uniref:Lectin n=1 Tax=Lysobacter hankyongensis TaxID=1176535 RepID=A0ABP9BIJ9_9GAMM